jgi:orotate phosphoribosyltransferase
MEQQPIVPWKAAFLRAAVNGGVLKFGSFKLKSNRISPYFFNAGDFYRADLLEEIATAFALSIIEARKTTGLSFDVVFGPAYKGIPLATATVWKLATLQPDIYSTISYSYDRKEAKTHGEGGSIVGAPLKGKRVLIVDDVITAGTAKREAVEKIKAEGGIVTGIVVALDRMEKLPAPNGDDSLPMPSAIGQLRKEFGVPIFAVLTLDDIVNGVGNLASPDDITRMEQYRTTYKPSD